MAACTQGGLAVSSDTPFAPDRDIKAKAKDGLLVGHRLMDAGEHELAIRAYTRAAAQNGISSDIMAGIGSANLALGRLGQAEDNLRDAIKIDPIVPQYWNNLGVVLMERGKFQEASQIFKRAFALDNGESDAIRDNLRLALAKIENPAYDANQRQEEFKLVRRGNSDYLLQQTP